MQIERCTVYTTVVYTQNTLYNVELTLTLVAKMVRINLPGMKVFRTLKHFTIMYVRGYCKVILIENKWKFSEASFIAAVKVI